VLTLFSTPKPFEGHIGIIQKNALRSWKLLHPDIEVILFGDDAGTAETCRELGIRHEPQVERSEDGPPLVRSLFERAQQISRHSILCYCNCDIILGRDFFRAVERVSARNGRFLMVGRRWDTNITEPVNFSDPHSERNLLELVFREGVQAPPEAIDYFVFPKGLFVDIPPLAIARLWWDHWLIWKASQQKAAVVDASDVAIAVHQNHGYSYHPAGWQGLRHGDVARRNLAIAGGYRHLHTLEDATHRLTATDIAPRRLYWLAPFRRSVRRVQDPLRKWLWHPLLGITRPIRHAIGLRQENFRGSRRKSVRGGDGLRER
jgi:hypothetical protein